LIGKAHFILSACAENFVKIKVCVVAEADDVSFFLKKLFRFYVSTINLF